MKHAISLAVMLFVMWVLWSGHDAPQLLLFGALSSVLVVALSRRLGVVDGEGHPIHLLLPLPLYWPWALWAIVKSGLGLARCVLDPSLPISPRVIQIKALQKSDLGRVIFANSITLTPGTLTLELLGDTLTVHALTPQSATELEAGEMNRRVAALEQGK